MKKEEILEKARKENKNKDYALIEAENKASKIAGLSIIILSSIYFVSGILITGKTNYGWYSILAVYCAIVYGLRGIKTHKSLDIFCGVLWTIASIMMIIIYFIELVNSSAIL